MARRKASPSPDDDVAARFWEKVAKADGCWLWTASRTGHGRGQFRLGGKMQQAHRVAWLLTFGVEPPKMLRSACGNQACVRPDHHVAAELRELPKNLALGPRDRFDALVRKGPDCWIWIGSGTRLGYGQFSVVEPGRGRKMVAAHRYAWEQAFGPIPADHDVTHACDNRRCVRPEHLRLLDTRQVLQRPTPAQLAVLRAWIRHGMRYGSVKLAATDLGIEPQSASQHLADLRRRLGVASTVAAVAHLDERLPSWRVATANESERRPS